MYTNLEEQTDVDVLEKIVREASLSLDDFGEQISINVKCLETNKNVRGYIILKRRQFKVKDLRNKL